MNIDTLLDHIKSVFSFLFFSLLQYIFIFISIYYPAQLSYNINVDKDSYLEGINYRHSLPI
jgi:hypothetical protein